MLHLLLACVLLAGEAVLTDETDPEPPGSNPFSTGWDKPVDPDRVCKFRNEKRGLTIVLPGKDLDLAIERRLMNSPRVLRDVEGDFIAEVRISGDFTPSDHSTTKERIPFVGAGLVLMAGEKTYIRLERAALRKDGEVKTYANWELRQDGKWVLAGREAILPLKARETFLRLHRKGNKIHGAVSEDGKKWHDLAPLELKLPAKLKLGIAAGTTSEKSFSPHYDRFKLRKVKSE
jgi:regulation of enolase protein 1 (concanavalin A-like superfamily)